MQSNHTPGPWTIKKSCIDREHQWEAYVIMSIPPVTEYHPVYCVPLYKKTTTIARIQKTCRKSETKANADLIAAAPDLFEALDLLVSNIDSSGQLIDNYFIEKAKKAIEKAKKEEKISG